MCQHLPLFGRTVTGTVLSGSNNIFTVQLDGERVRCRLKGKTLHGVEEEYNPLAAGDEVEVDPETALIVARGERRNAFRRWNGKRQRLQTIAANVDSISCVCCSGTPPFRPRFVDRVAVIAETENIPFVVVYNKDERAAPVEIERRLAAYRELGYAVVRTSARTGAGVAQLAERCAGGLALFLGQSGVGKSSLINRIIDGAAQRVGEVSRKYERGRHTTSAGVLLSDGVHAVIDTPGFRQMNLYPLTVQMIAAGYPEVRARAAFCTLSSCTHLHEPGCAVQSAVETEEIEPDRYESYVRAVHARNRSEQWLKENRR